LNDQVYFEYLTIGALIFVIFSSFKSSKTSSCLLFMIQARGLVKALEADRVGLGIGVLKQIKWSQGIDAFEADREDIAVHLCYVVDKVHLVGSSDRFGWDLYKSIE
jgi:hypothetical protein